MKASAKLQVMPNLQFCRTHRTHKGEPIGINFGMIAIIGVIIVAVLIIALAFIRK
jgi:hypothetical protein